MKTIIFNALLWGTLFVSITARASNIYVLDSGLHPNYYPQIENQLLNESCYSVRGTSGKPRPISNATLYDYRYISLCGDSRDRILRRRGASIVTTEGFPYIRNSGTNNRDVPISHRTHQSAVAEVIKLNTSPSIKQWHTHTSGLYGQVKDDKFALTSALELTRGLRIIDQARALGDLANTAVSLDGVNVVNISSGVENGRYPTPCDNHSDILGNRSFSQMSIALRRLVRRNVVIVNATANHKNNRNLDNDELPFPSCLSTVQAVAGFNRNFAPPHQIRGAINNGIAFVEDMNIINPVTFQAQNGTSYATPKVSAQLAELNEINPTLGAYDALNILRNTADLACGRRSYNNGTTVIEFCFLKPNFLRARSGAIDSFWGTYLRLTGGISDTQSYGWNFGTSQHSNGLLTYFRTNEIDFSNVPFLVAGNHSQGSLVASNTSNRVVRYTFNAYDIDTADEVRILVNDKPYGFLETTGSNRTGSTQTVCIDSSDLRSGNGRNEVKLRLKNGRETWGVTNLRIDASTNTSACQTAPPPPPPPPPTGGNPRPSEVLVSQLGEVKLGSVDPAERQLTIRYNYQPASLHDETVTLEFSIREEGATLIGFAPPRVRHNNRFTTSFGTRVNRDYRQYKVTLPKSRLATGENEFTITTGAIDFSSQRYRLDSTYIRNVRVILRRTPLLDNSIRGVSFESNLLLSHPFELVAHVSNTGPKVARASSVSFYKSINQNKSNSILLGSSSFSQIASRRQRFVSFTVSAGDVKNKEYVWACLNDTQDVRKGNDCSSAVEVSFTPTLNPVMMLLLIGDDESPTPPESE